MPGPVEVGGSGTPNPLSPRVARPITGPFKVGAAAGISQTAPTVQLLPIAGALSVRLRGKFTTTEVSPPSPMAVLSFAYRRSPPDEATAYSTAIDGPAASVNVVKDTEFDVNITPGGESMLAVTYTPTAVDPTKVTSVTFFDVMQL